MPQPNVDSGLRGTLARASIAIHEIADDVVTDIIAEFVLAVVRVDGWFPYDL